MESLRNVTLDARRFVYNMLGSGYDRFAEWDYSSVFSDANISTDRIYMKESTNKSDSYTSDNLLGAAYVAAKLNWGGEAECERRCTYGVLSIEIRWL